MKIKASTSYEETSYKTALSKFEDKYIYFDKNLNIKHAGFFRRLLGSVKALLGRVDDTQREVVVYRAIQFLELGAHEGWLDKTKVIRIASQFFINSDGRKNDEVINLVTKIFEEKSWKDLPPNEQIEFSQRYAQHHQKKLKQIVKQPLLSFISNQEAMPTPSSVLKEQVENFQDEFIIKKEPQQNEQNTPITVPPPYLAPKDPEVALIDPITPIQKAAEKTVLAIPIFILPVSLKGVSDTLRKTYPKALFVSTVEEFQEEMDPFKHQPVVAVFIERHDVALNGYNLIQENLEKLKSFSNVEPVYICASRKGSDADQKKEIKKFQKFLENTPLSKIECMAIDFEYQGIKQTLDNETREKLLQSLNGILEKNQKVVGPEIEHPSPTLQKNKITVLQPHQKHVNSIAPVEVVKDAQITAPVPVFVFNHELPLMVELLKKVYPEAIFTTGKLFQDDIKKLNNQPISTYYIHREDTRFSAPDQIEGMLTSFIESSLLGKFGFVIIYAKDSGIKLGTRPLMEHFQRSGNPKIKQMNYLLLPYSSKSSYKGNKMSMEKFFEKNEERELLEFINKTLKKD